MPNKINYKIKDALQGRGVFDKSSNIISSLDFGRIQPIMCRKVFPTDSWKINVKSFIRTANLPYPTNTDIRHNVRAFFVRNRSVWSAFDSFYTRELDDAGNLLYGSYPSIGNNFLRNWIIFGQKDAFSSSKFKHHYYSSPVQSINASCVLPAVNLPLSRRPDTIVNLTILYRVHLRFDSYVQDNEITPACGLQTACSFTGQFSDQDTVESCYVEIIGFQSATDFSDVMFGHVTYNVANLFKHQGSDYSQVTSLIFNEHNQITSTHNSEFSYIMPFVSGLTILNAIRDGFLLPIGDGGSDTYYAQLDDTHPALPRNLLDIRDIDSIRDAFSANVAPLLSSADITFNVDFFTPNWIFDSQGINLSHGMLVSLDVLQRNRLKLLQGLGYEINFSLDKTLLNAMPILCLGNIIYNYFLPMSFMMSSPLYEFFGRNMPKEDYSPEQILSILNAIVSARSLYDSDMFTSAWDSPIGNRNTGIRDDVNVISRGYNQSSGQFNEDVIYSDGNRLINAIEGDRDISSFFYQSLFRIQDWLTSRSLITPKISEMYKMAIGISLPDTITNEARHLGTNTTQVSIGDVMANSDSSNGVTSSSVGDYAGKAIGNSYENGETWSFDSVDDFGYIIFVENIVPQSMYYQGRNREITSLNQDEEFNAEQDALGSEVIRNDELFADARDAFAYLRGLNFGSAPNSNFGYRPRYSAFKVGYDRVLGDYRFNSINNDLINHFQARTFVAPSSDNPLRKNLNFLTYDNDSNGSKYDDMFLYQKADYDHFYITTRLNIQVFSPMLAIEDTIPFLEDHNTNMTVSGNGETFTK